MKWDHKEASAALRPTTSSLRRHKSQNSLRNLFGHLEHLECRQLLVAGPLVMLEGNIDVANSEQSSNLTVDFLSGREDESVILGVQLTSSTLNPAIPRVESSTGADVNVIHSVAGDISGGGLSVVELGPGDYTVALGAAGDSTGGDFQLDVFLAGDSITVDGQVDRRELTNSMAAVVQQFGWGNHVSASLFENNGIDTSRDLYVDTSDIDQDGTIGVFDYMQIEKNFAAGAVVLQLTGDAGAPVIDASLASDTGNDDSDSITTDPTISGTVTDSSDILSLLLGVDGAPEFEIVDRLGESGQFTLDLDDLEEITGVLLTEGSHTISLVATDELGNSTTTPFELSFTFLLDNQAPTIQDIPDQPVDEDSPLELDVSSFVSDPDQGDVFQLTLTGAGGIALPSWLAFDAASGALSGTPANDDVESFDVELTATDSQAETSQATFAIEVNNTNDAPTSSSISPRTVAENSDFQFGVSGFFGDDDVGDVLSFTATRVGGGNLPNWLMFDTQSGVFSGTPSDSDVGVVSIQVTATDQDLASVSEQFQLTVTDVNAIPELVSSIPDDEVDQGSAFSVDVSDFFSDADFNDVLSFSAELADGSNLPSWLAMNMSTGVLSGTPGNDDVGLISLRVIALDNAQASVSDTFDLTVNNINDAPIMDDQSFSVSSEATTGTIVGTIAATDPDAGDTLTFTVLSGNEDGVFLIDSATGEISVADDTQVTQTETFSLTVQVADSGTPALTDTANISLTVTVNQAPVAIGIDDQVIDEESLFMLNAAQFFSDPDVGDALTFGATLSDDSPLPDWLTIDAATGMLSGTPDDADVGTSTVRIVATDTVGAEATSTFDLTVANVNDTPELVSTIPSQSSSEDSLFSFDATLFFTDDDAGDSLTYEFQLDDGGVLPAWLSFSPTTGVLSGTPTEADVGTIVIDVSATDQNSASASATFNLTVQDANDPPVAADDMLFTVDKDETLRIEFRDLLGNDIDADPGDEIQVTGAVGSAEGAAVTIDSDALVYDPTTSSTLSALTIDTELTDTFEYTIRDSLGQTSTATVSVRVLGEETMRMRMETTDLDGNVITQVAAGDDFLLRVFVNDDRANPLGVASMNMDVMYTPDLIAPQGDIEFNPALVFPDPTPGKLDTPGLIDEAGAVVGFTSLGPDELLLYTVQFTAGNDPGLVTFEGTAPDVGELNLFFDDLVAISDSQVNYGRVSIEVVAPSAALSMSDSSNGGSTTFFAMSPDAGVDADPDNSGTGTGDDEPIVDSSIVELTGTGGVGSLSSGGSLATEDLEETLDEFAEDVVVSS